MNSSNISDMEELVRRIVLDAESAKHKKYGSNKAPLYRAASSASGGYVVGGGRKLPKKYKNLKSLVKKSEGSNRRVGGVMTEEGKKKREEGMKKYRSFVTHINKNPVMLNFKGVGKRGVQSHIYKVVKGRKDWEELTDDLLSLISEELPLEEKYLGKREYADAIHDLISGQFQIYPNKRKEPSIAKILRRPKMGRKPISRNEEEERMEDLLRDEGLNDILRRLSTPK